MEIAIGKAVNSKLSRHLEWQDDFFYLKIVLESNL